MTQYINAVPSILCFLPSTTSSAEGQSTSPQTEIMEDQAEVPERSSKEPMRPNHQHTAGTEFADNNYPSPRLPLFLQLPREIRDKIYRLILPSNKDLRQISLRVAQKIRARSKKRKLSHDPIVNIRALRLNQQIYTARVCQN